MRIVTAGQMKKIEQNCLRYDISMERLMENAGSAAAAVIKRAAEVEGRYITVFCGKGNNGGDGFVAARRLYEAGANAAVILTDGEPQTEQARGMLEMLEPLDIAVTSYGEDAEYLADRLAQTDILIDAVYGAGFRGRLDERHRDICRLINGVDAYTVALDIPSGVESDSGTADECAVCADLTVVFDSDKPATAMPVSQRHCGEVVVAEIGVPDEAREGYEPDFLLVDNTFVFDTLPPRRRETHKGDYGKLLVVAGSGCYMGAAVLAAQAAMRTGAGYVTLASTEQVCRAALPLLLETVMLPLAQAADGSSISAQSMETILEAAGRSTAVLIGNGLGRSEDAAALVYGIIENVKCPIVIDADGINAVAQRIDILKRAQAPIVLTPHPMELSRLTGLPVGQLQTNALEAGRALAAEYGVTTVLKNAYTNTVCADGKVYINTTGNAGLAKAGSGDVLAGIIGALAAQGHETGLAAACGVYLHGLAGDYAARAYSQYGMLPRDLIEALCQIFADNER